jgi:predicted  nucleic acid-binding Zn-ribbon protein
MELDELLCGLEIEVGERNQLLEDLNSERETLTSRLYWIEDRIQTLEFEVSKIQSTIKVLKKEY